jgi:pimeloyl-ACP methyl ester carboxylesterase
MAPRLVERGEGRPLIVIPGIQGRCEWNLRTLDALAAVGHAVTFSLADEPSSGFAWEESAGFENYLAQLDEVIGRTAPVPPVLVGISYGGLIAAEYLARRPGAAAGLVLASAPPPSWALPARASRYLKAPRLMAPVFWLGAPLRAYPEVKAAIPSRRERLDFLIDQGLKVAAAPASSRRMVRRLRWLASAGTALDRPLPIPSLIVTGEPALERVVPPEATLAYRTWLPDATVVTIPRTGHGGTVTRPQEFARCVGDWLASLPPTRPSRRMPAPPIPQEPPRAHRVS